ncbi:hypothetical protein CSOJ01_04536 [Colletotrichum sojae]|uniref:Uncharacterized protein n=1 Tax=Colletotrichum sojae TaxID=2175907 RepID=A0A8H6MY98_9PEZI|nr:hypothetical protein CSOJ01_04536 [Colletotrichum sojae]
MENIDYGEIKSTADLLISQGLTRDEAITEIASRLNAEAGADADDFDFDHVKEDNDADRSEAYDPLDGLAHSFDQKLNYFGTEWFDAQWHEVDGCFDGDVISPFQDVSDTDPPTFRLVKKRWTPKEIKTRSRELCSRDLEAFDEADLATLHEYLIRLDEALRQIMNFWPIKAFQVHGQWVRAIVIPPNRSHAPNKYESIFHVGIFGRIVDCCRTWLEKPRKKALKALRLTCRATEVMASPYLFEGVTISPTRESLERLDHISRRPHLNKGIMHARISVADYRDSLVQVPGIFTVYATTRCLSAFYRLDEERGETSCRLRGPDAEALRKLMAKWLEMQSAMADDLVWHVLLRQCRFTSKLFEAYKNQAEHKAVLENGGFSNAVADAMARMPHIKNVTISDHIFHGHWAKTMEQRNRNDGGLREVFNVLAISMAIMPELLSALGSRGVRPSRLAIYLTMPDYLSAFQVEDDSSRDHIGDSVRNVNSLTFAIRSDFRAEPLRTHGLEDKATQNEEDLAGLDSFVDPLLGSEYLSSLNVNLESLRLANEEVEGGWHLPSLMKARPWPKLRRIELSNVSLDSRELADFLGERPLYIRTLDEPRMEHGTWTEALDVMRERYDNASGAECDEMEDEDYDRTFGTPPDGWPQKNGRDCYDGYRLAEKYVRRELGDNTCRQYL